MVSIILPSRGRPYELAFSLKSLSLEKYPLEVLIWLDKDDPHLKRYKKLLRNVPKIKIYIKDRVGYYKFYVMLNFLSSKAKYDWILEWNDDAYMTNPNWFVVLENFLKKFDPKKEPVVVNIWGQGEVINNLFPIVSRTYLDILGHFALYPACDDWVRIVATGANISYNLKGIKPKHRKYGDDNTLIDQTYKDTERDRTKFKKVLRKGNKKLIDDPLNEDIRKIIKYKNENQIS